MSETTFHVTGMTCAHCVAAVQEEVARIRGVSAVDVDLDSGTVKVTSTVAVSDGAIREAVEEAGYQLTS